MDGGLLSLVLLVLSNCMLVGGQNCSLSAAQFFLSTVTVSTESVGGSTPGARVTWSTTIPPECVTAVRVNFRNRSGILVATNTTTNTSQTEIIQTGLQCTTYSITVLVSGEARDLGEFALLHSTAQVLVGAIPIPVRVRAEVTADNTSIGVSWKWSCQGLLDLVRVHYQPEGGSLMMHTVDNTTATSATLLNLQCDTEYTIWVYATGGLNNSRSLPRMVNLPARAPPTPIEVTVHFMNALSIRVAWRWTSLGPAPSCFNTTTVTYHPEGGGESSLQLSDPAATEATLTDLQCSTSYAITVVATAGEHRREGVTLQGTASMCPEDSGTPHILPEVPIQCSSTSAVAGVAVTAVLVLLVVAVVQSAVIWHQRRSIARMKCQTQRATAVTTEILLKECSAYGQIDRGGGEREEPHIYECPQ